MRVSSGYGCKMCQLKYKTTVSNFGNNQWGYKIVLFYYLIKGMASIEPETFQM